MLQRAALYINHCKHYLSSYYRFLEVELPGQSVGKILRLLIQIDKSPSQNLCQFVFSQQQMRFAISLTPCQRYLLSFKIFSTQFVNFNVKLMLTHLLEQIIFNFYNSLSM